jgi:predicted AlkP superfamily phosphohydrolase/phosphomutase
MTVDFAIYAGDTRGRNNLTSRTKVLFLAMDAGDKNLIRSWAEDGTLKNMRILLDRGLVGDTISLEGFFEGATWPSFYTGVTPGRHGFHRLIQLIPGTYELFRCYPGNFIKHEPFWNYLCHAGRRVAVLDVPLSGISMEINGIQMVEWGSHDATHGFCTWPKELRQEVLERFGRHPLQETACDSIGRTPQDFCNFRDRLIRGVQTKAEMTMHYLKRDRWDFFAQVFTEGHCVGHQCWHFHDPRHPNHAPEIASITGDPVRDVYRAIDIAIGEILAQIDNDTTVLFLASHGMAHNFGAQFLLPDILLRLEVAIPCSGKPLPSRPSYSIHGLHALLKWTWRHAPQGVRDRLNPVRQRLRRNVDSGHDHMFPSISGIDPGKSKCFPVENAMSIGGIRVNLAGREPHGIIKPGSEMDNFCLELSQRLLEIVDCDAGIPVIKSVRRTSELYRGESLDCLPDLLVEWSDDKFVGALGSGDSRGSTVRLTSDKIGLVEGVNSYCRTGDHRPEGLFIACGPGIRAGQMERTVSIMDFASTFAELLGVKLTQTDGKPITEILTA